MRIVFPLAASLLLAAVASAQMPPTRGRSAPDWMIDPTPFKARVMENKEGVELNNGLIRRVFRLKPNAAAVAFDNLMSGQSILRSVRAEARLELDGVKYDVGGLAGQPIQNYLDPAWLDTMKTEPSAFRFTGLKAGKTEARFRWKKRLEWMPSDVPWPPPGVSLTLEFEAPEGLPAPASMVKVEIHYELYDGLPLLSKWLVVRNGSEKPVRLNTFVSEILAAVEAESIVDDSSQWQLPDLMVETDYTFGGMSAPNHSVAAHWMADPLYRTQVNYKLQTPCLLECRPPLGPDQIIGPGARFESFRVFELACDSSDRERKGLALRRMYRALAPWVTENPVLMHVRDAQPDAVKLAIDQCAETGFELAILSFGSGFDFESRDAHYQRQIKELADYARSKGIALGGYSLLASRSAGSPDDNTQGPPARFGVMPCLGSRWGKDYLAQLKSFITNAGLGALEHDGSYPGDLCAATNHPGHRGLNDSQWAQWKAITEFYEWCRSNGVYLNIPDWYFLNGGSKTAMGYREDGWSLPRPYQEIIERQDIFDGTWEKTPSMGWMFVPLSEYQGGGAAATIEPLQDHLPHYEQRLADLFGAGVMACWRGPRLYDSGQTEAIVKKWVDFYKRHRAILNSDILHLRRADGRDLDYILHVNPALKEKGLLMVYNPLDRQAGKRLNVPLYYTGLAKKARVRERDGSQKVFKLRRDYSIELPVSIPARGVSWFVIE
ncbi:MAG: hypothetical protein ABSG59_20385 [Verrucomicrobiota bacterium]